MGGGGGGSGKVGYAGYIEDAHELMINGVNGAATFTYDLRTVLDTAIGNNPYTGQTAYSPDTALVAMVTANSDFDTIADTLVDETALTADMSAYDAEVTNVMESTTIPKFDALMRDIGAVQSSTYAIGKALIYAEKTRNVDSYHAKSRIEWKKIYIEAKRNVTANSIEIERMRIASKHDEEQRDAEIEKLEATWQVDTLVKGGQFLGILGGGSMIPDGPSKAQSAIAGGLAGAAGGAAIGTMVAGPMGTFVGAIGGGVLGAGASFL